MVSGVRGYEGSGPRPLRVLRRRVRGGREGAGYFGKGEVVTG